MTKARDGSGGSAKTLQEQEAEWDQESLSALRSLGLGWERRRVVGLKIESGKYRREDTYVLKDTHSDRVEVVTDPNAVPSWIKKRSERHARPGRRTPWETAHELYGLDRPYEPDEFTQRLQTPKERPWLEPTIHDYQPETVVDALRRLAADSSPQAPSRWHSPLRAQLIADGLIRVIVGVDGLWVGDILTASGRKMIR